MQQVLTKAITLLLGAWMGGTLVIWLVATISFRNADRVLSRPTPEAAPLLLSVPEAARRPVLRHLASEFNRLLFPVWGALQLVLGGAVLVLLLRQTPRSPADLTLAGILLLLVVVMLGVITPVITSLGRTMDFVPRTPPPPQMAAFGKLHAAYSFLDLIKLVLAGILAFRIGR